MKSRLFRLLYLCVAVVAAVLLRLFPAFSFMSDEGIKYQRQFEVEKKTIVMTRTDITTGNVEVTSTTSIAGLFYCSWVLIISTALCLLSFFKESWRMVLAWLTMAVSGIYYLLLIYYAIQIADQDIATFYPTWVVLLPAIIIQMMVLLQRNIRLELKALNEDEEEESDE